jgi:PAS domain S-box-containing protein
MKSDGFSKSKRLDALKSISRAAEVGAVVAVSLTIFGGFMSYSQLSNQLRVRGWVVHTYEVLNKIQSMRADFLTSDAVLQRGGDTTLLRNRILAEQTELQDSTRDSPLQQALNKHLATLTAAYFSPVKPEARPPVNQLFGVLEQMEDYEQSLLDERTEKLRQTSQNTFTMVAVLSVLAVISQTVFAGLTRYWARAQRETEARLTATLGSMAEGLYQVDPSGNLVYMNRAAEALFGHTTGELVGQNMHDIIHHKRPDGTDRRRADCALLNVIQTGIPHVERQDCFVRKDGSLLPVEISSSPLREDDGTIAGAVVCFSDITERQAVEKRLSEFYSIVSHELRTPLTSIRAALGLLEGGVGAQLNPKGQHLVQIGRQESERLVRLINDILDVKKIESGKLDLDLASIDASKLVHAVAASLEPMANERGLKLVVQDHASRIWIRADYDRITQVLTNLVSNALKFGRENSVVTVQLLDEGDSARFNVIDQGQGIPEEKLSLLFGMFQQLDATDARSKGGTGLGLAICKAIVEAHGGSIGARSTVGVGSEFSFTIPVVEKDTQPEATGAQVMEARATGKKVVLIVDDDYPTCQMIRQQLLESMSAFCIIATKWEQAVELAKLHRPDGIVLDVLMPIGSGFDVVDELNKLEEFQHTPLIVYTAKDDLSDSERERLTMGRSVWLVKSKTTEAEFTRTVKSLLCDSV